MEIGILFPQTEYGSDPGAIREFAQSAEELGFTHILTYEHVLGVSPDRPGWKGIYSLEDPFLEPISLLSFMAAVTKRIGFMTSIMILPQRQTVLAAKQAATLDVLSGGRLRLGVGIGWNEPEYIALGQDFHNRGRRIEEQIELMRSLWTKPLVNFSGQWTTVEDSGLNPLPVQRPIPIWFGGHADAVIRRAARMGDGWIPNYPTAEEARPHFDKLGEYLEQAGRSPSEFGIEVRLHYRDGDPEKLNSLIQDWQAGGATHFGLSTLRSQLEGPTEHLEAMRAFASALLT
ncbi:MAG: LLM class F420-dependent oxidoreductase [Chloroflexi bacterium]|nr:LLM class F420-dependent oxidoreductase [Chloroflexota bacterium]MDK1045567.1 LLM class F420-dependent oxidoreductase [Anaerolineales bacterium]MCH8340542.1 LLM class F420-dependent oxidoreductase [Chloroflexota bacterium]MCI0773494.1 LLM class F420-dependent oxidoreductase [Chloroflexota bacterium]MCI0805926.1 LLM class F420-dependent oxidoreductase [Chloroflexota bacterium]